MVDSKPSSSSCFLTFGLATSACRIVSKAFFKFAFFLRALPEATPAFFAFSRRSLGVRSEFFIKFCSLAIASLPFQKNTINSI
nr:MAG TPA: hypothetical protein [Caudoviricetes sp.]